VKFKNDLSGEMEIIAKAISSCAYNADVPVAAFRYKDRRVIMQSHEIAVKDIGKEADAIEVIDYLKDLAKRDEKGSR
jgi:hypothetical protein